MGGAQAGEVASRLATAAFREYHEADDLDRRAARRRDHPGGEPAHLRARARGHGGVRHGHDGHRRARRGRTDRHRARRRFARVPDRAGPARAADRRPLARRRPRPRRALSPEEAETHPQRSVITARSAPTPRWTSTRCRSTPKPATSTSSARTGSTTMIGDEEILAILERAKSLEHAGKDLVKAANRRGGEDNVTVVLFSVESDEPLEETAVLSGDGQGTQEDLEDTLTGLEVPRSSRRRSTAGRSRLHRAATRGESERRRSRSAAGGAGSSLSLAGARSSSSSLRSRSSECRARTSSGADEDGRVAVYQGRRGRSAPASTCTAPGT